MEVLSRSTKETKKLAKKIADTLKPGDVLALYGDLGSGKTTFTRFLVEALGLVARVQSPTFIVTRRYTGNGEIKVVNHVDLYRLTSKEEVEDLGLNEFFEEQDAISIVEWPELAESFLPKDVKKIRFEYIDEDVRRINVQDFN